MSYNTLSVILEVKIMKKILIVFAALLAICLTVSAVSADDVWSFNFSSSESSNTDGGAFSLENGKLKLQDIEFTIPDGYKENESARKLAAPAEDIDDAKYSVCQFVNDGKEIFVKVFFFDDDGEFNNLTAVDDQVAKKMGDHDGVYEANKYNDNTPTFRFLKDGKLVEINAPDDDTINAILKH